MADANVGSIGSEREIDAASREAAAQHAATFGVAGEIHPGDFIFWHIHDDPGLENKREAPHRYLASGRDTATLVAGLLGEARVQQVLGQRADPRAPVSLLDFASGYGRVTRHLSAVIPNLEVWGCDIHPEAVAFMRSIGLRALQSSTIPEELSVETRFDVIFSFSFFTHMPRRTWRRWLQALARQLTPHGVLIFTAHGDVSQRLMGIDTLDPDGFFFHVASEQEDLDLADYGNTVTTFPFVHNQLAASGLKLLQYKEAGAGHHDVYVVSKATDNAVQDGAAVVDQPIFYAEEIRALEARNRALKAEIEILRASTSWRLLTPFRTLVDALRR